MKNKIRAHARVALVAIFSFFYLSTVAVASDQWLQVKSKNFLLIGNASEKDIRKVGTRLEQFRETLRQLLSQASFNSSIPTKVVVFKSDSSYKPFKPKRADGKLDTFVAGYFQPGPDVNYITLSTEGDDAETFGTIFHEYVHFIVDTNLGKSEIPPWFNEGLAEYYSTFQIENDQEVKLGLQQERHIALLRQSSFIPLEQLFKVTNYQLPQSGDHSRTIFYAESWALMHYLIQGGKGKSLDTFLNLVLKDVPQEKAFQQAFQMPYADMEKELRKYVEKATYQYSLIKFARPMTFDAEMQTTRLDEAASNAYLGDLLYHVNRADDAESYLLTALKLQSNISAANTTLGMVKVRQRKWDEAKSYLEKAIAEDQTNHMAYYQYAYLLSREGRDDFGYVKSFPEDTENKMREALKKAIALQPSFTESYELMAFVSLVSNKQLDEAVALLKKALAYQPGNQRYALRIAEILVRQSKFSDAQAIAAKIAATADDPEIKGRAENLTNEIRQRQEFEQRRAEMEKRYGSPGSSGNRPILRRPVDTPPTEEEIKKLQEQETLRSVNMELRKPVDTEKRVLGYVQKIDCKGGVTFTVKSGNDTFSLVSKDFQGLDVNVFDSAANNVSIGCGADIAGLLASITYKERTVPKSAARGDLIGLDFVPKDFRFLSEDEMKAAPQIMAADLSADSPDSQPPPTSNRAQTGSRDIDAMRRDMMMQQIRQSLREPQAGEKREMGYLDHIECTAKGSFFYMKTAGATLKLLSNPTHQPNIKLYTNDLEGLQFGCQTKAIEVPAVFVYKETPDGKAKSVGELLTLEFVPKSFVL